MPTSEPIVNAAHRHDGYVENTIPVLAVSDVQKSIHFYCDVLGFKLDWGGDKDTSHICSVSRDGHCIMLERRELAAGIVWIGGTILVPLWDKIRSSADITVIQRPTNHYWALDMKIKDPDGNVLWFGTESLNDVSFNAEPADGQLPRNR